MKYVLTLSVLVFSFTHAAQGAVPAGQQILASVNQLESDAKDFSLMIGEGQDCSLKVEKIADGIRIGMQSAEEGFTSIDVKYSNAVALKQEFEQDGSYLKEYNVPGQGVLTAVNADDSYFHASLESHGKKVTCELDF